MSRERERSSSEIARPRLGVVDCLERNELRVPVCARALLSFFFFVEFHAYVGRCVYCVRRELIHAVMMVPRTMKLQPIAPRLGFPAFPPQQRIMVRNVSPGFPKVAYQLRETYYTRVKHPTPLLVKKFVLCTKYD